LLNTIYKLVCYAVEREKKREEKAESEKGKEKESVK